MWRVSQPPYFSSPVPNWQPQPQPPAPEPPRGRGPLTGGLIAAVIVLVVLLAAAGTVAVVQTGRLADERQENEELAATLDNREAELESLRQALEERPGTVPDLSDPLQDLEDSLSSELEDLLGGDLDGLMEQFEDLFGPDGPLGEDLLGGLDGLTESLGPVGPQPDVSGCLGSVTDLPDIDGGTVPAQVDDAVDVVEALRGDDFPTDLTPSILTSEEIRERIEQEVVSAYSPEAAAIDHDMLAALGAIPEGTDLVQTQTDLLGDQVAGFYDPETQELVVRSDDPNQALDAVGLITMIHELEHALADAVVGLPEIDDEPTDEDAALAELAIVEGDAVAMQTLGTEAAIAPLDLLGILGDPDALAAASAGTEGVPPYLLSSLTFPYVDGPTFVCDAFAVGGWDAVDELLRDPPATTAEILYGAPVSPVSPDPLPGPEGHELVEERTFGAAQLSWLFAAPGGDEATALSDPVESARGWRGGRLSLWRDGDGQPAIALALVDGGGLCDAVTEWWQRTEGTLTERVGTVMCRGDQVTVGVAATEALALAALGG